MTTPYVTNYAARDAARLRYIAWIESSERDKKGRKSSGLPPPPESRAYARLARFTIND